MPSLFKKFRHRKNSSSASSASSYTSTPPSPVAPTGTSSSAARRGSLPHSPRRSDLTNPSASMMADRSEDDVVVIGAGIQQTSISGVSGGGDGTGHSQPFGDESYRPDLPTTTSNVNNPAPDSSTLGWTANKALPTLPEVRTPQPGPSTLAEFPLPPTDHNASSPSPLPHVNSVDRGRLHESEQERPKPVISSSEAPRNGHAETFPHVSDLPVQQGQGGQLDGDWSKETLEAMEIPARNVSLLPDVNPTSAFAQNNQETNELDYALTTRPDLRNVRDPDITPEAHIAKFLENFTVFHTVAPSSTKSINYAEWDTPALKAARNEMVTRIATEAYARESARTGLTSNGVDAFRKSGLGDKVGMKGTIDVHTQWLEPVIQETIRRIEVTEYFTIIDREIHKYHIYPKIQPIQDPDPIVYPTRHRIFSPADGEWHEVIGDAAAIEILGEEVFRHGPQQRREVRRLALPGLGLLNGEEDEAFTGSAMGRVLEREGRMGGTFSNWKEVGRGGWITKLGEPVYDAWGPGYAKHRTQNTAGNEAAQGYNVETDRTNSDLSGNGQTKVNNNGIDQELGSGTKRKDRFDGANHGLGNAVGVAV